MQTHTHLLVGLFVAGRKNDPRLNTAAFLGALTPDVVLYCLLVYERFVLGRPLEQIFHHSYHTPLWQEALRVGNSIPLFGAVLLVSLFFKARLLMGFSLAALVHVISDFFLHHDDAYQHFWPLSEFVFRSPVSYWDPNHFGVYFLVFETILVVVLALVLWRRHCHGVLVRSLALFCMIAHVSVFAFFTLFY